MAKGAKKGAEGKRINAGVIARYNDEAQRQKLLAEFAEYAKGGGSAEAFEAAIKDTIAALAKKAPKGADEGKSEDKLSDSDLAEALVILCRNGEAFVKLAKSAKLNFKQLKNLEKWSGDAAAITAADSIAALESEAAAAQALLKEAREAAKKAS